MKAQRSGVRGANLMAVLHGVVFSGADPSRADLAKRTGLTRATISNLVDELIDGGLLAESEPDRAGGTGRPATPLTIRDGAVAALGLEVDVHEMGARVIDLSGRVVHEHFVPGDFDGLDVRKATSCLRDLAAAALARPEVNHRALLGACVSVPGVVAADSSTVMTAPNLMWREVDLAGPLASAPGLRAVPVNVVNNADLAASTESWERRRAGRADLDFLHVTADRGVGGGLVRGGQLYRGARGWAMEIGHVCVDPNGPPCRCGSSGCLEQYIGTAAWSGARARGDVDTAVWALTIALTSAINVLDVPEVVLGGVLRPLSPLLSRRVEGSLADRLVMGAWADVSVVPSLSDERASLTGAALTVLGHGLSDPHRLLRIAARGRPDG